MVTNTTGINAFDRQFYQDIASMAAKYHRESHMGILDAIPIKQLNFNVDEYKKPIFGESKGIYGGKPGIDSEVMLTALEHNVYKLKNVNAHIAWDQDDMMNMGPYLIQERAEQIAEHARQATVSIFKGVYSKGYTFSGQLPTGQGSKLINGILDDATSVTDLNGSDSQLDAAGDIYKALTKFVETVPFRYLEQGEVNLLVDPLFYSKANSTTFTNDNGVTEWEQFLRFYRSEASPYKVGNVYFSNDLTLVGGTDTVGTNSRLVGWVSSPNIVERAYSRGFGIMGESQNHVGGVDQTWTVKLAGCVHDANAVLFSEQITY